MFSQNNPNKITENPINDQDFDINSSSDNLISNAIEDETLSTVKLVEKISNILSPYFIVIVGLYLYDDNFLFGLIFILIGVLSLLKISYQDILQWINNIKSLFINSSKKF